MASADILREKILSEFRIMHNTSGRVYPSSEPMNVDWVSPFNDKDGNAKIYPPLNGKNPVMKSMAECIANAVIDSGGSIYWQDPIISKFDPTSGTPTPATGNRYISTATSHGWVLNSIYEYYSGAWVQTASIEGLIVYNRETNEFLFFDGSSWLVLMGSSGVGLSHPQVMSRIFIG